MRGALVGLAVLVVGCVPGAGEEEQALALRGAMRASGAIPAGDLRLVGAPLPSLALPATIKVWRRAVDGSTDSCAGRVDVLPFESYVKGVVPNEWIASWGDESLKAGAVAARTYAFYWVHKGGKYMCADIDDTTASQVYKDTTSAKASADVDATAGQIVVDSTGAPVFAEYSAENGDPTADGIADPVCAGQALNGHGHGMCQWGTQRWSLQGKSYDWMVAHYYPGKTLQIPGVNPPPGDMAGASADGAAAANDLAGAPSDGGSGGGSPDQASGGPPKGDNPAHVASGCSSAGAGSPSGVSGLLLSSLMLALALGRRRVAGRPR